MNDVLRLAFETAISLLVSLAVLRVMSDPLVGILRELCPSDPAARFWLGYTRIMLVIVPLLLVLGCDGLLQGNDAADQVRLGLMAALAGLLLGMFRIGQRIARHELAPEQRGGRS